MLRMIRLMLIGFLASIIYAKCWLRLTGLHWFDINNFFVVVFLLIIVASKNRFVRVIAIPFLVWGLIDFIFYSVHRSEPGAWDFTYPLEQFIYGTNRNASGRLYLRVFPFYFYIIGLLFIAIRFCIGTTHKPAETYN